MTAPLSYEARLLLNQLAGSGFEDGPQIDPKHRFAPAVIDELVAYGLAELVFGPPPRCRTLLRATFRGWREVHGPEQTSPVERLIDMIDLEAL